ncbi:TPA: SymE family type I addiction module toxin [Serratia odorifera]|nr:SymE family type I addiction module toxin [Serratia odorifera]
MGSCVVKRPTSGSWDWLTKCGLTGQPLAISVMLGQVVIQFHKMDMLL